MRSLLRRAPRAALAILGFHNLTPTPAQPRLAPDFPERFGRLCGILARRYDCVTVSEGVRRLREGMTGTRPLVAVIFDDGYADVHGVAWPILRAAGIPATSYVIADCLETGRLPWYEQLGRLMFESGQAALELEAAGERYSWPLPSGIAAREPVYWQAVRALKSRFDPNLIARLDALASDHGVAPSSAGREVMMSPSQARELAAAGIEIGSHSLTHPILPALGDAELEREIAGSRRRLADLVAAEITSFCFPNGDNDARCLAAAERAGYASAVSMACGANRPPRWHPYQLHRIPMSERIFRLWPWHTLWRIHTTLIEA